MKNNHWAPDSFPTDSEGEKVFTITRVHFDKAFENYAKTVELDPEQAMAQYRLGRIYERRDQIDQATSCYRQAIELKPAFIQAYERLGGIHYDQQEFEQASKFFIQAVTLNPDLVKTQ